MPRLIWKSIEKNQLLIYVNEYHNQFKSTSVFFIVIFKHFQTNSSLLCDQHFKFDKLLTASLASPLSCPSPTAHPSTGCDALVDLKELEVTAGQKAPHQAGRPICP